MPDPEGIRADATEEPQPVQFLHDRLAGLLATHALEGATRGVDRPVWVHDVDGVEAESAPYLEVVGVMRRGDFEDTSTEFGIYVLVGVVLFVGTWALIVHEGVADAVELALHFLVVDF